MIKIQIVENANSRENVEHQEHSFIASRNVKWHQQIGKTIWLLITKVSIILSFRDLAPWFLLNLFKSFSTEKPASECLLVTLFIVAQTKSPRYPSMGE